MENELQIIELLKRVCDELSDIKVLLSEKGDSKLPGEEKPRRSRGISDDALMSDIAPYIPMTTETSGTVRATERTRDKTRYMFNEKILLKNRLVYEVVRDYVGKNPKMTVADLKRIFPKELQGSLGVVEYACIADKRTDCRVRFFADEGEELRLADGNAYVCSQWGIINIPKFIERAALLGYKIEQIK